MELRYGGRSGLHLSDHAPIFHYVDPIAQCKNLVESVRYENKTGALLERPNPGEQNIDITLFKDRGRFIQQNNQMSLRAFLQGQRFGEFDHLACGETELRSTGTRINVDLNFRQLTTG